MVRAPLRGSTAEQQHRRLVGRSVSLRNRSVGLGDSCGNFRGGGSVAHSVSCTCSGTEERWTRHPNGTRPGGRSYSASFVALADAPVSESLSPAAERMATPRGPSGGPLAVAPARNRPPVARPAAGSPLGRQSARNVQGWAPVTHGRSATSCPGRRCACALTIAFFPSLTPADIIHLPLLRRQLFPPSGFPSRSASLLPCAPFARPTSRLPFPRFCRRPL